MKFFSDLFTEDLNIGATLGKSLLDIHEEVQGVTVMYESSRKQPIPFELLIIESEFMASKKQFENALKLAKLAGISNLI